MRECPYCLQAFSTKQRLVSHLTKKKKCYDIEKVGVPPILLEMMGFEADQNQTSSPSPPTISLTSLSNECELITQKTTRRIRKLNKVTDYQCEHCKKYFVSQKNVDRHIANTCPKLRRYKKMEDNQIVELTIDQHQVELLRPHDPPQDNITEMVRSFDDEMYQPKHTRTKYRLPPKKNQTAIEEYQPQPQGTDIKYIEKEDYISYLIDCY